jgi:hypothetical protein
MTVGMSSRSSRKLLATTSGLATADARQQGEAVERCLACEAVVSGAVRYIMRLPVLRSIV